MPEGKSLSARADELEHAEIEALEAVPCSSVIYTSGEKDPTAPVLTPFIRADGKPLLMSHDKRLKRMPDKPHLLDFFKYRFFPANHVLQSATLAKKAGHPEKVILACLLHDISIMGFIRGDHGYWAAQLVAPYVDEEVAWAIRSHQVLRFFPDPDVGYEYPALYVKLFGEGYRPEPYIQAAYEKLRQHKWYMTGRLITINDIYAFDPNAKVDMADFTDIIGRNFRQPEAGLGFDDSPSAHMWRTINWPTRAL
ncbi:MAG TPA: HD domain-containing protein [Stellaceae bacterium]|nr:HD domain-containing protein [Stellaceae bacterium]